MGTRSKTTTIATRRCKYYNFELKIIIFTFCGLLQDSIILLFICLHLENSKSKSKRSAVAQSKGNSSNDTTLAEIENSRVECTFSGCSKSYSSKKIMNLHITRSHIAEKFKCKICGKILESKFSAQRHVLTSHKKECMEDDIEKTICSPLNVTPVRDQDQLIKEQEKEIENLIRIKKEIKDQIKYLRTKLIAKRQK